MFGIFQAFKHGFVDGWNNTTIYKHLYINTPSDVQNEDLSDENLIEELATLEEIYKRQYEIGGILNTQLKHTTDKQKRIIILNKLNTLDKQTMKTQQRMRELTDILKDVE